MCRKYSLGIGNKKRKKVAMALNKQKGNMYNWVTHTWNPLGGECPHKCIYCSTRALCKRHEVLRAKYSGPPRIVEKELKYSHGKNKTIFVCNMVDLFAETVSTKYIDRILNVCRQHPENTYLLQSKNSGRFYDLAYPGFYPERVIFATTIETNREDSAISQAPRQYDRARGIAKIKAAHGDPTKITITVEPIMVFDLAAFVALLQSTSANWISIGANSCAGVHLNEPSPTQVGDLLYRLNFCEVRIKSNLRRLLP